MARIERPVDGTMRAEDQRHQALCSHVRPDSRIPAIHPPRLIRRVTDPALADLSCDFATLSASEARPSIAPKRVLRALLIQAFYPVRSERQLMKQIVSVPV